jgi:hypothetical protein
MQADTALPQPTASSLLLGCQKADWEGMVRVMQRIVIMQVLMMMVTTRASLASGIISV